MSIKSTKPEALRHHVSLFGGATLYFVEGKDYFSLGNDGLCIPPWGTTTITPKRVREVIADLQDLLNLMEARQ